MHTAIVIGYKIAICMQLHPYAIEQMKNTFLKFVINLYFAIRIPRDLFFHMHGMMAESILS